MVKCNGVGKVYPPKSSKFGKKEKKVIKRTMIFLFCCECGSQKHRDMLLPLLYCFELNL